MNTEELEMSERVIADLIQRGIPEIARRSGLPEERLRPYLAALANMLRGEPGAEASHLDIARGHAVLQWDQEWELEEIVKEYQSLREVLGLFVEERLGRSLSMSESLPLYRTIDAAVSATVAGYRTSERERRVMFTAHVSHDLRNPLYGILGMLELLQRTPLDPEQIEYAETTRDSAERLLRLLNDLLDLTQVRLDRLAVRPRPFSLARVLQHVVRAEGASARRKGLRLELVLDAALPDRVVGDPDRLTQILGNLIDNAVKFTLAGRVELLARPCPSRPGFVLLEVRDTGPGIPMEEIPELFLPFSRGSRPQARGVGLGLHIVQTLARAMGGDVAVQSVPGQGASFLVHLPLPPTGDLDVEEEQVPQRPVGSLRVLLAEDAALNRMVLSRQLEKLGCIAETVADGQQALTRLGQDRFDLVFLDGEMPGMNGWEVARELRNAPLAASHRAYLVALTAHGSSALAEFEAVDEFLTKPVSLAMLHRLLERVEQSPGRS